VAEGAYHKALEETYGSLSDTFKVLRRALPITKQPVNWGSIAAYRLGADLTASARK
jgi:capping protein alpha